MASSRERKPFTGVFLISVGLHVGLLLALSGVVIFTYLKKAPVQFKTPPPPPVQRIEPRKLEYKVRMQESQKKSGRPTVSPRLSAQSVGDISLPEVKTQLKPTPNKTLSNLSSFGGNGLGDGLGGGTGSGGLGLGVSAVNFFGIQDRGERIAFLVDVSLSMLEDEKGGVAGFQAVKNEIVKMVKRLSPTTFFNVYFFGIGIDAFQPKMTLASDEIKEAFEHWVEPFNTDVKNQRYGNLYNNYQVRSDAGLASAGGTSRMDAALTAAFEQGADTIFVMSDGAPVVNRPLTEAEMEKSRKSLEEYEKWDTPARRKAYEKAKAKWDADLAKENEKRAKKGLPPKITEAGRGPSFGGGGMSAVYSQEDILNHIKMLSKSLYEPQKRKSPRIHCIGYVCNPSDEQFMRTLTREHQGHYRRIKSLVKPITGFN